MHCAPLCGRSPHRAWKAVPSAERSFGEYRQPVKDFAGSICASFRPGYACAAGRPTMRKTIALLLSLIAAMAGSSAAAETLKIAVAQRGFWNSSFVEFAQRQGFFKQEGLDIEILYTEGGASTLTPVIAGSLDIAMTNGTLGVIAAFAKGLPVK